MSVVITLSKPIKVHAEEVTQIELREPTAGDLMDNGHPLNINGDESFHFRLDVVGKYISTLGQIPMSSVRQMAPADLNRAALEISSFFG